MLTNLTAYNEYITNVIIATIVYLSAFSLVIKMLIGGRKKKKALEAPNGIGPNGDTAAEPGTGEGVTDDGKGGEEA